jgi:hypothetical protein
MKNKKPAAPESVIPAESAKQLTSITSLDQLQTVVEKKVRLEFEFAGAKYSTEFRRLTPSEEAIIDEMLASVLPPTIKGKTQDDDRVNFNDLDFVTRRAQIELQARSVALYWCVPMFSAAKPNLTKRDEIHTFIQSKLNAQILNMLWNAIRNGGVTVAELVNFT